MLTELQRKKYTRHFHLRDINNDGYVERADYEQYAQNIAKIRGWQPESPDYENVLSKHLDIWNAFWKPADADGDDRVTLEEHLGFFDKLIEQYTDQDAEISRQHTLILFDTLDANSDGKITVEEYRQFFEAAGVETSWSEKVFSRLDLNGDRHLSRQEFEQHHWAFFTSDDPESPGNWFYGPLE
jgi:juvenile hormone diol kinase